MSYLLDSFHVGIGHNTSEAGLIYNSYFYFFIFFFFYTCDSGGICIFTQCMYINVVVLLKLAICISLYIYVPRCIGTSLTTLMNVQR